MGFRTVIISSRAKLECRMNYLIVRAEQEKKIFLREINTLIIQSTAVAVTAALLSELMKNNVKVIFCDEKCNPVSELLPYYGTCNTSKRYKSQCNWGEKGKSLVWQAIIRRKIREQANFLSELGFAEQAELLHEYETQVLPFDTSNREGHAAKVYFNCLFGGIGSRSEPCFFNGCLNYGYAVILSAFNREIVASGYLTQLGIWHDNEFNEFNLGCDMMEPFRVVVDRTARALDEGDAFFKKKMINVLNYRAQIEGKWTTLDLAIRIYVKSVLRALNEGDASYVSFVENVELSGEF